MERDEEGRFSPSVGDREVLDAVAVQVVEAAGPEPAFGESSSWNFCRSTARLTGTRQFTNLWNCIVQQKRVFLNLTLTPTKALRDLRLRVFVPQVADVIEVIKQILLGEGGFVLIRFVRELVEIHVAGFDDAREG